MILQNILPFAKSLITTHVEPNSVVIDATAGNGHDTLFLLNTVPQGHVYAFDIQKEAIEQTRERTASHKHLTLIQDSHVNVTEHIQTIHQDHLQAAMFNLGYLPNGDKTIVTNGTTTIKAIESIFNLLQSKGIIVIVVYPGHEEGNIESQTLMSYLQNFDQDKGHVIQYGFVNKRNHPPYVVAIEKK